MPAAGDRSATPRQSRVLSADSRQPTAASPRPRRAGISLLEVLISMFVLLFGLLGVASIFPVGNFYAGRGDQYDRGTALSEAAYSELEARGMLRPGVWVYPDKMAAPTPFMTNGVFAVPYPLPSATAVHPGHAFVLDPLGAWDGLNTNGVSSDTFGNQTVDGGPFLATMPGLTATDWDSLMANPLNPPGKEWPIRRLTLLQAPDTSGATPIPQSMTTAVAETIFNLRDDLTTELPKENDRPGIQRWRIDTKGNTDPSDDEFLARAYVGNYSWLATIVPTSIDALAALQPSHPMYGSAMYDVSVAVFYKREVTPSPTSERAIIARMDTLSNELTIYNTANNPTVIDDAAEDIRAGQWIAVAGVHPTTGQFLLKWYRLLSFDDETQEDTNFNGTPGSLSLRRAMLDGPDWPEPPTTSSSYPVAENLRAILLPGVIGVTTRTVTMQME